jgi:uncharacterized metal-binding protein YceD (DUF177 family)
MTDPAAEFSRLVPLAGLTSGGDRHQIAAEPAECEALAERFGLVGLDHLAADVVLRRQADGVVLLEAAFEAAFLQSCVVTLEPVVGTISERFALRYGPPWAETAADIALAADEPAFEPLTGDVIDIGEAVAQELSLQLPPFPRLTEAGIEVAADTDPPAAFAALAECCRRKPG